MVPERGSLPFIIQDNPCNPLLHIIRFLWILEGTEVPLQVILLSILLIGLIKIPCQTILHSPWLWIYVSHFFHCRPIKITPLLCPAYSTSPLIWWGTLNCPLIFIICVFIDEVHHLRFYHLRIPHFIRRQIWCNLQSNFRFRGIILLLLQPCTWHIRVDHTRNIAVNSNVILLLPYSQTKNKKLTPLWSLSLFQWIELWVVPDDNSAWKQFMEDWASIWWIRTVSTISNWHPSEIWNYSNGQNCGLFLMMVLRENRGWYIGWEFCQSIITVSIISNWHLSVVSIRCTQ